jgi:saccharopepsin
MLGIVALNALLLIVCCIVWLVSFIRKRRTRPIARTPMGRMSPMPPRDPNSMTPMPMNSYIAGGPPPHVYEPVSMAITEDTFVPPTPAFHSFDRKSNNLQPGDRPKSIA